MKKFSAALGWLRDTTTWSLIGYYDYQYCCSIDFFILYEDEHPGYVYYSLTLVCFNLVLSVAIVVSYIIVTFEVYKKDRFCFAWCKYIIFCYFWKNFDVFKRKNAVREAENRKVFKRISFILLTDLLCWIPLCLISLSIWCISMSKENLIYLMKNAIPFKFTFLILFSLNSILNPYIYSYHRLSSLYKKIQRIFYST